MKMNVSGTEGVASKLASQIEERMGERNQLFEFFFAREAPRLAEACREMSERFLRGDFSPLDADPMLRMRSMCPWSSFIP
jgi:hypothetical protein